MKKLVMALLSTALAANVAAASDWTDNVKVKGDLRYRHELIDVQNKDARNRQRLRARISIEGKVSDMATIYFGLASGSSDPVSTNQTFTDAFSTKSIGLDLAYFEIRSKSFPGFTLDAGKMKNPFFRPGSTQLIWDSDLNPEGGALSFKHSANENVSFDAVGSGLWVVERSAAKDSWIAAGQARINFKTTDKKTDFVLGGSYFDYVNAQGYQFFYDMSNPFGNSYRYDTTASGDSIKVYDTDYHILELFAQATHHFNEIPVTVYGDYANNTAADSNKTGWLVGVTIGHAKKPGSWDLSYNYRKVEPDAVVGIFNDSDFRNGGTDGKGHKFAGNLAVADNMSVGATYFINTMGLQGSGTDFNRLQLDLQLKF